MYPSYFISASTSNKSSFIDHAGIAEGSPLLKKFNFNGIKDKIIELLDMSADDWNRETIIAREQLIFNSNSVKPIDDFSKIIIK